MFTPGYQPHFQVIFILHVILFGGLLLQVLPPATTHAQVTTAITPTTGQGNLGTAIVPPRIDGTNTVHDITGGFRPGGGPNLFHSFGKFSIGENNIANFLNKNQTPTNNILSRVTGGNPSNIFGSIQTDGFPNANFFFMNPAGIVFGPKASLQVEGSVHFTTADYLRMTDNIQFTAVPGPTDVVLSVAPVAAFGFLNENPAGITYDGTHSDSSSLAVHEGEVLSLVGGSIRISGDLSTSFEFDNTRLIAPGGQVTLISVASSGEAVFDSSGLFSDIDVDSFAQLGDILLNEGALIDLVDADNGGDRGGTVIIRSGRLEMVESAVFADTVDLDGASVGIDISVRGDILINDSFLTTDSFGEGNAGDIRIKADSLHLMGTPNDDPDFPSTKIGSVGSASGETGNIEVKINNDLLMEGRAEITTTAVNGNAGDIDVSAVNVSISGTSNQTATGGIGANTRGSGDGGRLQVTATSLTLTNQANIQSSTFPNTSGNAGTVTLNLTGNLVVEKGSVILGDSDGTGRAADLDITAKDISIIGLRDATDPTDRLNGMFTGFDSSTGPAGGQGGNIDITAQSLQVTDQGIIKTSTEGTGGGGAINVTATTISLTEGASITAESTLPVDGAGNAGRIQLTAKDTISIDSSTVTTQAENAFGGNIILKAQELIHITNSQISSDVQEGSADAGSINIDPQFIVVQNGLIDTSANVGDGGDVRFVADSAILIDPFSTIDTSSRFGGSGTVDIRAPIQNLGETIAPLPEEIVKISELFAARCAAQKDGNFSSFVQERSVGSPLGATGFLSSPLVVDPLASQESSSVSRLGFNHRINEPETLWAFLDTNSPETHAQACASNFTPY